MGSFVSKFIDRMSECKIFSFWHRLEENHPIIYELVQIGIMLMYLAALIIGIITKVKQ